MTRPDPVALFRVLTDSRGIPERRVLDRLDVELRCACSQRHLILWAFRTPEGVLIAGRGPKRHGIHTGSPSDAIDPWFAEWWDGDGAWTVGCPRGRYTNLDGRWLYENRGAGVVRSTNVPDTRGESR